MVQAKATIASAINGYGEIVGRYTDQQDRVHAFLINRTGTFRTLDFPKTSASDADIDVSTCLVVGFAFLIFIIWLGARAVVMFRWRNRRLVETIVIGDGDETTCDFR